VRKSSSTPEKRSSAIRFAGAFGSVEEWRRLVGRRAAPAALRAATNRGPAQKGKLRPIPADRAQMRDSGTDKEASRPKRPATVSHSGKSVIRPVAGFRCPGCRALQRGRIARRELRHGGDFAAAAKRFSGLTAPRRRRGRARLVSRRGVMVKEFEDVASIFVRARCRPTHRNRRSDFHINQRGANAAGGKSWPVTS